MTLLAAFFFSFAVILMVVIGMAVGVLNGRPAIRGSCGGLNGAGCEHCSKDCATKRRKSREKLYEH